MFILETAWIKYDEKISLGNLNMKQTAIMVFIACFSCNQHKRVLYYNVCLLSKIDDLIKYKVLHEVARTRKTFIFNISVDTIFIYVKSSYNISYIKYEIKFLPY